MRLYLLLVVLAACCTHPVRAQLSKIRTSHIEVISESDRKKIIEKIESQETQWDNNNKLLTKFVPPTANHYHSVLINRTNHPLRENAGYASDLMDSRLPRYQQRAFEVIEKVISRQDQDPASETYGIWPYYDEESLKEMAKPDWNWADFISVRLLETYINHADVLPPALKEKMKGSMIHAARSIMKRDVKPGYTNIAIMGTFVTYVISNLFDMPEMQKYADMRLKRFYDYTLALNGFAEYNSPTYTKIALDELARMKKYIADPEALRMTDACYRLAWKGLASHFHAPTGQLAGPHSRSYSTLLREDFYDLLYTASNGRIAFKNAKKTADHYKLPHQVPADLLKHFTLLTSATLSIDTFGLEAVPPVGYSYLHPLYSFGTVSRGSMWEQRRPYIAYWGNVKNPKFLRVRLLHDFVDFAAGQIFSKQKLGEALTTLSFAVDGGDYHISLDRLKNGKFDAKDLRLRFEIGDAASINKINLDGQSFTFADKDLRLVVHMAAAQFDSSAITVKKGHDGNTAWVDWIIYSGGQRTFNLANMQHANFTWTTSFNDRRARRKQTVKPSVIRTGDFLETRWQGMQLKVPVKPAGERQLQATVNVE